MTQRHMRCSCSNGAGDAGCASAVKVVGVVDVALAARHAPRCHLRCCRCQMRWLPSMAVAQMATGATMSAASCLLRWQQGSAVRAACARCWRSKWVLQQLLYECHRVRDAALRGTGTAAAGARAAVDRGHGGGGDYSRSSHDALQVKLLADNMLVLLVLKCMHQTTSSVQVGLSYIVHREV